MWIDLDHEDIVTGPMGGGRKAASPPFDNPPAAQIIHLTPARLGGVGWSAN